MVNNIKVMLGDVFNIASGGTPTKKQTEYYQNGTIPWVKTGDLKGKYITSDIEYITELGLKNSSAKLFPSDTVLVAMYGATIGACSILPFEASTNQACAAFLPNKHFDSNYLYYFLCSKKEQFIADGVGGAQPNISASYLKKCLIPFLPLEEQQKIAATLDKVTALISLRKKQLEKLDELVKSRFVEMFGEPETNPKGWQRQRFDELCEILDSRRIPITSADRKAGIYPYYGASGIVDYVEDYIFDEELLLISEDGANLVMRTTPIAFSISGKTWVNNHAHVARFGSRATQKYIEVCFALIDISGSITGTAQPKLNQAKLNAMLFCMPPIELQEQFAAFVAQTDKSKLAVQKSLEQLETLKKSLMQKYFG